MLILLWGLATEQPLVAVYKALLRLGVPTVVLNQRDVLTTTIDLAVSTNIRGGVRVRDMEIDLSAVTAVYARPYDARCLPRIAQAGAMSPAWRHAGMVDDTLAAWLEITPALVVNRFSAMATNSSKPYQLEMIRQCGFNVPDTVVTTDPEGAQAFWDRHGQVIYKSVSGIRSTVTLLGPEHVERFADLAYCPTQFQQYIPGRDHRVHVVGEEVFAAEIISEAIDYRRPGPQDVTIRACRLPQDVEDRCRQLAATLQLHVAGIDLRRSPEGAWYCFEANPSPAFTYYQEETQQPIDAAIARLLVAGARK